MSVQVWLRVLLIKHVVLYGKQYVTHDRFSSMKMNSALNAEYG